jgi:hypothetical protein
MLSRQAIAFEQLLAHEAGELPGRNRGGPIRPGAVPRETGQGLGRRDEGDERDRYADGLEGLRGEAIRVEGKLCGICRHCAACWLCLLAMLCGCAEPGSEVRNNGAEVFMGNSGRRRYRQGVYLGIR